MMNIKQFVDLLVENKMKNISVYDLTEGDQEKFIILCTSSKPLDSKKAADVIAEKYGYTDKIEGYFKGEWIVFDFQNLTLHIFLPRVREKYNLDKLYKPRKITIK